MITPLMCALFQKYVVNLSFDLRHNTVLLYLFPWYATHSQIMHIQNDGYCHYRFMRNLHEYISY